MSERSIKGQSTQRYEVTDAYRATHEAVFGERKPSRGRWVWDKDRQALVPEAEFTPPPENSHVEVMCDFNLDGTRAPDGTDIGSRRKRDEWMRRNGVTFASDYSKETLEKAKAANTGRTPEARRELTETVGRIAYRLSTQRKK